MKTKTVSKVKKEIKDRLEKTCSVCGKNIKVILYIDHTYRGGYYFFKIPISSKAEWAKAHKAGTRNMMLGNVKVQVLKKDPKPYRHIEYWECSDCHRGVSKN